MNKKMKKCGIIVALCFLLLGISGCTQIDGYSEARKDPDNWESQELYQQIVVEGSLFDLPTEDDKGQEGVEQADTEDGNTIEGGEAGNSKNSLRVYFLNVGQGSASLLTARDSTGKAYSILIDGGNTDQSSYVVSYLKDTLQLQTLDLVITTHYDSDHCGGVIGCLNAFEGKVGVVMDPDYKTDTKIYDSYLKAVTYSKAQRIHPVGGETYELGDLKIDFVGPCKKEYPDENDNSLCVKITYGECSYLFMGDAGKESIEDMLASGLDLSADVLLLPHHGSFDSYSEELYEKIGFQAAVISAKMGNSYGHPHREVMHYLKDRCIPIYRTDLQGEFYSITNGLNILWSIDPCDDYLGGSEREELNG